MSAAPSGGQPGGAAPGGDPNQPATRPEEEGGHEQVAQGSQNERPEGVIRRRPGARVRPAFPGDPGEPGEGEEEEEDIDPSTLSTEARLLLRGMGTLIDMVESIDTTTGNGILPTLEKIKDEITQIKTSNARIRTNTSETATQTTEIAMSTRNMAADSFGNMRAMQDLSTASQAHTQSLNELVQLGRESLALLTPAVVANPPNQRLGRLGAFFLMNVPRTVGDGFGRVWGEVERAGRGVGGVGNWFGEDVFGYFALLLFLIVMGGFKWYEWNQGRVNSE